MLVTQTDAKQLQADINDAVKASQPVVTVTGEKLSQGNIPLAQGGGNAGAGADSGAGTTTPGTGTGTTTTPNG